MSEVVESTIEINDVLETPEVDEAMRQLEDCLAEYGVELLEGEYSGYFSMQKFRPALYQVRGIDTVTTEDGVYEDATILWFVEERGDTPYQPDELVDVKRYEGEALEEIVACLLGMFTREEADALFHTLGNPKGFNKTLWPLPVAITDRVANYMVQAKSLHRHAKIEGIQCPYGPITVVGYADIQNSRTIRERRRSIDAAADFICCVFNMMGIKIENIIDHKTIKDAIERLSTSDGVELGIQMPYPVWNDHEHIEPDDDIPY